MESSPQSQENLAARLKNKRICRFCMSQREPLTNIYSKENRVNSSAPLPLQIMSCVSIEVFTNDGMPATICEMCRRLMEYCYRFKQMCKKADTSLRQFPLTSKWPDALEIPKLPDALRQASEPQKHVILNSIPVVKIEDQEEPPIIERTVKPEVGDRRPNPQTTLRPQMRTPTKPKILNKSSMKILNKSANVNTEPILSSPIITQNESGQMEIVTEIIEVPRIEEPDPVLTAEPVETNVFPCPHCERSFPLRQLLDIHMVNHNRERSFACELCDKRFFSKYDLGKHMLIHTGEKPYKCVVCNKSFTRSTLLHRHEKVHIDQPKFLCVFCEKPFLSKDELDKHTERHQKSRPFPCKICGKSFAFKQGLERHETIHARQQPFPCQYCEQSFSTPSKLSRHLTAHAGDRPFPCKLCPKSYLLSHHLTRHMRSHTQGSGSFKCYDCERSFATRDDLIYHSAVHATQNLMCPLCKEQFENLEQVTEHIKQHSEGEQYACEFCDLIFLTEEKLQSHCETKHVDDMAAYDQHDKRNEKGGASSNYNSAEESQEEVLQEFIIEEYDGTADNIKQEGETHIEDAVVIQSSSAPAKKVKILNKEASSVRRPNILRSLQNRKVSSEPAAETMEIEELEKYENKDDEEQEEMLTDDDETYEPPPKITRFIKSVAQPAKSAPPKPVQQQQKSVFKVPVKKEARLTQPTISAVLQQLPKTVTIVKKEKQPSPENKIAPASQVRVLNEKIIKKADDSPTLTKSVRLTDVKTPVRVIEKKSTSPNENIPVKNKASPIAGPSNTTPEVKAAQKQSPTTASKSPQSAGKKNLVEMMIDNRKVKVQKIVMTKAEVAAMAKEGKIEMKGGTMILKQNGKSLSGKIVSKQTTPSK